MATDPEILRAGLRITCADAVGLMTEFLEDALEANDRDRFDQHLSGCTACAVYLDQLRTTVTVVGTVTGEETYPLDEPTMERLLDLYRQSTG